jgi:hypothetical protein
MLSARLPGARRKTMQVVETTGRTGHIVLFKPLGIA